MGLLERWKTASDWKTEWVSLNIAENNTEQHSNPTILPAVKCINYKNIHVMRFFKDGKLFGTLDTQIIHAKFVLFIGRFKNIG